MTHSFAEALLATDYANWPSSVRREAIVPVLEIDVSSRQLRAFVEGWPCNELWCPPEDIGMVFPKIAVCSWKCFPWLLPAQNSVNLFPWCSHRMRTVLGVWLEHGLGCRLRYFPFVDYSAVNEYRFSISSGKLTRVRDIVRFSDVRVASAAENYARQFVDELDHVLVDIAAMRHDSNFRFRVVELNPAT